MTTTKWTYQPVPLSGAILENIPDKKLIRSDQEVFALRLSPSGLAEAMTGGGVWHRIGERFVYGSGDRAHTVTVELKAKTLYFHNGDL